jgi:DNA-binding NarL/FixJ family response regulator
MTTARRVFVIWVHPIFHDSVRVLLQRPDVDWVGATNDHAAAPAQIAALRPDTVLIEEDEGGDASAEALSILASSVADVRVIRLSMADNELNIYHREHRTVAKADDLFRLIQSE